MTNGNGDSEKRRDDQADGHGKHKDDKIAQCIKRAYSEVESEPLPDRLNELLQNLRMSKGPE